MTTTFLVPKNNAYSTLASSILIGDLSLDVATGEGARFPSTYPFHITIDSEILECTSRTNDTLTVTRAAEGTSAAGHSSGATVRLNITAEALTDINTAVNNIEGATYNQNAIINGCMRVAQRGTSFTAATTPANNDDTYLLDQWILLSDGNDVVDVTQVIRATPNGSYAEMKAEVETANKQFGFLQILEARNSARFIGKTVSLSFKARMAAADDNTHSLKAVILSWDGVADTVTSDVVNVWGATPTYVANWTAENTPSSNTLTTAEQTFKVESVPIDTASAVNIAVFIFCDQTDGAIDDAVIITDVQFELGSVATPFEYRPYGQELALCQRYCLSFRSDQIAVHLGFGTAYATTGIFLILQFSEMRAIPTLIATASDWQLSDFVTPTDITTMTIASTIYCSRKSVLLSLGVAGTPLTQYRAYVLMADGTANRELFLTAEL